MATAKVPWSTPEHQPAVYDDLLHRLHADHNVHRGRLPLVTAVKRRSDGPWRIFIEDRVVFTSIEEVARYLNRLCKADVIEGLRELARHRSAPKHALPGANSGSKVLATGRGLGVPSAGQRMQAPAQPTADARAAPATPATPAAPAAVNAAVMRGGNRGAGGVGGRGGGGRGPLAPFEKIKRRKKRVRRQQQRTDPMRTVKQQQAWPTKGPQL